MATRVLITGANRGIGLALCQQYQASGAEVIAVCRRASAELLELGVEIIDSIELTSEQSVLKLTQALGARQIGLLINNAGILRSQSLDNLDFEIVREQFQVNAVAPLRLVKELMGNLIEGSKIAMITSRMGSIEDNSSGSAYGYRMSKSALNAAGKSLAIDLKPNGIAVALLHPGYVQTEMVNFGGEISATEAARRLVQRIEELSLQNSGTFWHSSGEVLPW